MHSLKNRRLVLHLGAPSHAVEPALLARQLPCLAKALQRFAALPAVLTKPSARVSSVHIYAAQLGVQRDHITLECLPRLGRAFFTQLQERVVALSQEFSVQGLIFTPSALSKPTLDSNAFLNANANANPNLSSGARSSVSSNQNSNLSLGTELIPAALGVLNIQAALPAAANFIGRNVSSALPRSDAAKVLRQLTNAAQMSLHQTPIICYTDDCKNNDKDDCTVNSIWCGPELSADLMNGSLASVWLQAGLAHWWDALAQWDGTFEAFDFSAIDQLEIVFSDAVITVPLKRRSAWALWQKPLELEKVCANASI